MIAILICLSIVPALLGVEAASSEVSSLIRGGNESRLSEDDIERIVEPFKAQPFEPERIADEALDDIRE